MAVACTVMIVTRCCAAAAAIDFRGGRRLMCPLSSLQPYVCLVEEMGEEDHHGPRVPEDDRIVQRRIVAVGRDELVVRSMGDDGDELNLNEDYATV